MLPPYHEDTPFRLVAARLSASMSIREEGFFDELLAVCFESWVGDLRECAAEFGFGKSAIIGDIGRALLFPGIV